MAERRIQAGVVKAELVDILQEIPGDAAQHVGGLRILPPLTFPPRLLTQHSVCAWQTNRLLRFWAHLAAYVMLAVPEAFHNLPEGVKARAYQVLVAYMDVLVQSDDYLKFVSLYASFLPLEQRRRAWSGYMKGR